MVAAVVEDVMVVIALISTRLTGGKARGTGARHVGQVESVFNDDARELFNHGEMQAEQKVCEHERVTGAANVSKQSAHVMSESSITTSLQIIGTNSNYVNKMQRSVVAPPQGCKLDVTHK